MGNETQRVHGCRESWQRTAVRALLARDEDAFRGELLGWSSLIAEAVYRYRPRSYDDCKHMLRGELRDMAGELCSDTIVDEDSDFESLHAWIDVQLDAVSDNVVCDAHEALGIQYERGM